MLGEIRRGLPRDFWLCVRSLGPQAAMCEWNSGAARREGRGAVAKVWALLAKLTAVPTTCDGSRGSAGKLGRGASRGESGGGRGGGGAYPRFTHATVEVVERLLDMFGRLGDVQTVAVMACVLFQGGDRQDGRREGRGGGDSGSFDDGAHAPELESLIHPSLARRCGVYVEEYAELLHRWGAVDARAEILSLHGLRSTASCRAGRGREGGVRPAAGALRLQDSARAPRSAQGRQGRRGKARGHDGHGAAAAGLEPVTICWRCNTILPAGQLACSNCYRIAFKCALCHMGVQVRCCRSEGQGVC